MGKYCYKCGAELRNGAKFCQECGAKQDGDTGEVSTAISDAVSSVASSAEKVSKAVVSSAKSQVAQSSSGAAANASTMPLVAVDAALFAIVTFLPWVTSYYAETGSGLSLPRLAKEGMRYISTLSEYSKYAYEYGADEMYRSALGVLVFVALVAGIGWLSCIVSLYYDAKHDLKGEQSSGGGSKSVAAVAAIVQGLVWIGVAYLKSSLQNDFFDVSYALDGVVETTMWVWVAFAAGVAGHFFRRSIYQNLGWIKVTASPSQGGQAN